MDRIDKLKAYLSENPQDSFLQHALALEYIKRGKDEEARVLFQSILALEPGYVGSYYHLGKLLERIGETEEAVTIYKKGMEEAKKAGESLAERELKAAYEELVF